MRRWRFPLGPELDEEEEPELDEELESLSDELLPDEESSSEDDDEEPLLDDDEEDDESSSLTSRFLVFLFGAPEVFLPRFFLLLALNSPSAI